MQDANAHGRPDAIYQLSAGLLMAMVAIGAYYVLVDPVADLMLWRCDSSECMSSNIAWMQLSYKPLAAGLAVLAGVIALWMADRLRARLAGNRAAGVAPGSAEHLPLLAILPIALVVLMGTKIWLCNSSGAFVCRRRSPDDFLAYFVGLLCAVMVAWLVGRLRRRWKSGNI